MWEGLKGVWQCFDWQVQLDYNLIIHVQNIIDNTLRTISQPCYVYLAYVSHEQD